MPMLSMSSNPTEISKQIKAFKETKQAYEKAHKEWLKGRDIKELETHAFNLVDDAKKEAEKINLEALAYVDKSKKIAEKTTKELAIAEGKVAANSAKEKELTEKIKECDSLKHEYTIKLNRLNKQAATDAANRKMLIDNISKLQSFINDMHVNIN